MQRVCDRVAILDHGRLVSEGAVSQLLASQAERLRLLATPVNAVLDVLDGKGAIEGEAVLAEVTRGEAPALLRALVGRGVDVIEARWVGADLERVFLQQTGEPRV